jgi:hypothetical protein
VGIARYLATAATGDLDRTLWLADSLVGEPQRDRVALVECGRPSPLARELAGLLTKAGRIPVSVVIQDRELAQSETLLRRLSGVSEVWVFADNLFDAYMSVFATQLTFAMRRAARDGLPMIGVGAGAMALGGLLVAHRVCASAQYDLVSGLGWAPRVLVDGGADRGFIDGSITRHAVRALPGLLGVDVGRRGGVKVFGGRVESVGDEPVVLLGADAEGNVLTLSLEPGQMMSIAPPPFAPFTRELLTAQVQTALSSVPRAAARPVPAPLVALPLPLPKTAPEPEAKPVGRLCPMCNKVHSAERVELAA